MNRHLRILLLEANRYHALLVEREFSDSLPSSVVSVFHSAEAAREELANNPYDALIVDDATAGGVEADYVDAVRSCNDRLIVVVVSSERISEPAWVAGVADVNWLAKDDDFHRTVVDLISESIDARLNGVAGKLSSTGSSELADADIINIAANTLSHEINNPLQTILGETELLLQKIDRHDNQLRQKIRVIRRSAFRIKSSMTRLAGMSSATVKRTDSGVLVDSSRS